MFDYLFFLITIILLLAFFLLFFRKKPQNKEDEKIKIIGLGGGGCNIAEYLWNINPKDYDVLIINSDKKALDAKNVDKKILLQKHNTYGCGANILCGYLLITPNIIEQIRDFIKQNNKVYIIATLGGGCGTGSLKAIAQEFKDASFLLNFIVTTPFKWEGLKKQERANETIEELKKYYKNIYIYSNDNLLNLGNLGINECFKNQNDTFDKLIKLNETKPITTSEKTKKCENNSYFAKMINRFKKEKIREKDGL